MGQSKWFIKKMKKKNLGTKEAPFIYLIEVTKGTHNQIRNMIMDVNKGGYSCTCFLGGPNFYTVATKIRVHAILFKRVFLKILAKLDILAKIVRSHHI